MKNPDLDTLQEQVGGKYKLAALVKRRTHQLVNGAEPLIETKENLEPFEIALEEIRQEKVRFDMA
jgi:DNA-directed RNA polymerase omega subunit